MTTTKERPWYSDNFYGERGLGPGTEETTLRALRELLNKENKWPIRLKT
jgi:hypothetical protein